MKKNYLTIHGHFYQPPRENPWTGVIDKQPSAAPYNDWNERITSECYEPLSKAVIRNNRNKISERVNLYEYLSFNIGPTLIDWLKKHNAALLQKIIEADKKSILTQNGHGNAISQVYNHLIMPLATEEDQKTQIVWGLKHFKHTFQRKSEGIWLSETAIGRTTIKALIDVGLKFTILSPTQARNIRKFSSKKWYDVSHSNIDPKIPYRVFDIDRWGQKIKNRYIDIFFYDGPLSTDVSFQDVLIDASSFGFRIQSAFSAKTTRPQLVNIATDGEVYGHHKKFAELGLAYLFRRVLPKLNIKPLNYARFLEINPPEHEVILKNGPVNIGTSWSCSHGVERWYGNCGCQTGGGENWNQKWRTPLREALNILKEDIDHIFFKEGRKYFFSPVDAKNNYIDVLLDPKKETKLKFIKKYCKKNITLDNQNMWALLQMELNGMLMFTSCGWFFSDISGIETIQIIAYAAKTIEEAKKFTQMPLEENFIRLLSHAISNKEDNISGSDLYKEILHRKRNQS